MMAQQMDDALCGSGRSQMLQDCRGHPVNELCLSVPGFAEAPRLHLCGGPPLLWQVAVVVAHWPSHLCRAHVST